MDIGLVGLGKMGGNMRTRLRNAGHTVIGYDRNPDLADADSLAGMVEKLPSPKVVWVMVPAGDPTRGTIEELGELLGEGDLVVNVTEVFDSWRSGTVIRSWLLDLLVAAVEEDPHLDKIAGYAEDSGEGRWTVEAAIEHAVPMNVIAASLFARFTSRQDDSPAMKAIAAMRNQFGGHAVHTEPPAGGDVG